MDAVVEDGADVISTSLGRVGASTIDRIIRATAYLGIGDEFDGQMVKDAGGPAMILTNNVVEAYDIIGDAHVLLATHVSYAAEQKIKAYINSTSAPTATIIFKGMLLGTKTAPIVAFFSSRGPSLASLGILKPDTIGPGVSILATRYKSLDNETNAKMNANLIVMSSGTSLSCPHLSGNAALVKNTHPDWSLAAIKSALMTSATQANFNGQLIANERVFPADVFAVSAGHANPPKAIDPSLIYDITSDNYVAYLCGLGNMKKQTVIITRCVISCHERSIPKVQLNNPSFSIQLGMSSPVYSRTLTKGSIACVSMKHIVRSLVSVKFA
ncbi:Cucumisin [Handroanthus impetiginosus]|uniref:Cucumisin n=1 Tax=Handroanthus impetiginosus TaxID=429701 RepID=A0A2G9FZ87_9LAMI|nr:Cucumisin [Handroanthus impetiginosus]